MPLDPLVRDAEAAMLALMAGSAPASPEDQRDLALRIDREVVRALVAEPPTVDVQQISVHVPDRADVVCHIFTPTTARRHGAQLFFFGGAFRQGGIHFPSVDALLRARAAKAETVIVAPDYALAPEEPFPIALEQGIAALAWIHGHADALGIDPADVSVGGMSAGGDLAAVIALLNRDGDRLPLRQQILEVPVTDLTGGHLSLDVAPLIGLDLAAAVPIMQELAANYLAGADPRTPTASPLFAPDLSDLPPAHVLVAEYDVFRGDGEAYVDALASHGTPATLHRFDGMTHGSLAFTRDLAGAQEWERTVVDLLRTTSDNESDVR